MFPDIKEYLDDGSTAITGDAQRDALDFGSGVKDLGKGTDIRVEFILDTAFAENTGTVDIVLQDSDDDSTYTELYRLGQLDLSSGNNPAAGHLARVSLPADHGRYVRVAYVTSGTVADGKVKAFLIRG